MTPWKKRAFALSFPPSDAEFDAVVGYLEDIIMDYEFQLLLQRNFMDNLILPGWKTQKNKLPLPTLMNLLLVENILKNSCCKWILGFNMAAFTTLQHHKDGSGW